MQTPLLSQNSFSGAWDVTSLLLDFVSAIEDPNSLSASIHLNCEARPTSDIGELIGKWLSGKHSTALGTEHATVTTWEIMRGEQSVQGPPVIKEHIDGAWRTMMRWIPDRLSQSRLMMSAMGLWVRGRGQKKFHPVYTDANPSLTPWCLFIFHIKAILKGKGSSLLGTLL